MAKNVVFSDEMRKAVYGGAHKVALAVGSTLGPAGRTVLIDGGYSPLVTRDGVTVAKNIDLADPVENLGASLMKNISSNTDQDAGDGTSTATVIADAILAEGLKVVDNGVNPIQVKRGIDAAVKDVVEDLKGMTQEVETEEQIAQVAAISANNDKELGQLIADAISKVGTAGVVTTAESNTGSTDMDFVEGMAFDRGYMSPYFSTDRDNLVVEYNNPYILITDKSIGNIQTILPILDAISREGRPLLIIAEDVEAEVLSALIVNALRGVIKVCAVKSPGFGDRKKDMVQDIAILTGGQLITEDLGLRLETSTIADLGQAVSVKVTKDNTTIIGGQGESANIEARVKQIQKQIDEATSDYDREKLQERLARLAGGVAVIKVGDVSETALKEKKFRIEDALNATRAAIAEGIIPGGGTALCQISKERTFHETPKAEGAGYDKGYDIVIKAICEPVKKIAENAGVSGEVVADKVKNSTQKGVGYNALTGEYVDMLKAGIVDPVKVTRLALQNAASVASLIITSSASITTIPEKAEPESAGMVPMGSMM